MNRQVKDKNAELANKTTEKKKKSINPSVSKQMASESDLEQHFVRPPRKCYWIPLESNPEMFNSFAHLIGVPESLGFSDVFGLDDDALSWVPKPCYGVVFLAPYSKMKAINVEQAKKMLDTPEEANPNVWYMKQIVGNACGTIAVLHVLCNAVEQGHVKLGSDSFLGQFIQDCVGVDVAKRGEVFEQSKGIEEIHTKCAVQGQTETPAADAKVDAHFVALVNIDGALYELDGGKVGPINHGPTNPDTFLKDVSRVVQENFIRHLGPDELFSLISFGALQSE